MTKGAWVVVILFWLVMVPLMVWGAAETLPYLDSFIKSLAADFDAWRGVK